MSDISLSGAGATKEEIIDFRRLVSDVSKAAKSKIKHDTCLLCGKKVDGFCKSHCVPQMCLNNIDTEGMVGSILTIIDNDVLNKESGIASAGVFHNICHDCDNTAFQTYENPGSYFSDVANNNVLLNQIALKNILRDIYKHELELEFLKEMPATIKKKSKSSINAKIAELSSKSMITSRKMDIEECYSELEECKLGVKNNMSIFDTIVCETLDYSVPVAYQGRVALNTGFDGEIINNKYNISNDYRMEYIHLSIFPFDNKSIVMLFISKKNERYNRFIQKMQRLPKTKRIQVINFILFSNCEDYFLSKNISRKTLDKIKSVSSGVEDLVTIDPKTSLDNTIKKFDLKRAWSFTNVLGIHN